MFTYKVVSNL